MDGRCHFGFVGGDEVGWVGKSEGGIGVDRLVGGCQVVRVLMMKRVVVFFS